MTRIIEVKSKNTSRCARGKIWGCKILIGDRGYGSRLRILIKVLELAVKTFRKEPLKKDLHSPVG